MDFAVVGGGGFCRKRTGKRSVKGEKPGDSLTNWGRHGEKTGRKDTLKEDSGVVKRGSAHV